jgi:hypothetical protein
VRPPCRRRSGIWPTFDPRCDGSLICRSGTNSSTADALEGQRDVVVRDRAKIEESKRTRHYSRREWWLTWNRLRLNYPKKGRDGGVAGPTWTRTYPVSFTDPNGIRHSVDVHAETLYEAMGERSTNGASSWTVSMAGIPNTSSLSTR